MKDAKFRAWNKIRKYMTNSFKLSDFYAASTHGEGYMQGGFYHNGDENIEDFDIMEYTGKFDNFGDEICENDRVKIISYEMVGEYYSKGNTYSQYKDVEIITTVFWDKEACKFNLVPQTFGEYSTSFYEGCGRTKSEKLANQSVKVKLQFNRDLSHNFKSIEIIGNTYVSSCTECEECD